MRKDARLIVYLNAFDVEDKLFRDRATVAAKTLGIPVSALLRRATEYALDNVVDFRKQL